MSRAGVLLESLSFIYIYIYIYICYAPCTFLISLLRPLQSRVALAQIHSVFYEGCFLFMLSKHYPAKLLYRWLYAYVLYAPWVSTLMRNFRNSHIHTWSHMRIYYAKRACKLFLHTLSRPRSFQIYSKVPHQQVVTIWNYIFSESEGKWSNLEYLKKKLADAEERS